ncbi:double-strand break repair protein AddB [Roseibium sp. TrichSKD4]|uniref:double-strand break repair protein AddB n=1 Tax=Roseibium sp. TrichSKD4 TaxID=744980 RepID=UPI0001E56768|nr:double-strand break repair protein AddB [Roseibium sp. TrichSKD4]EFO32853.1 double-strand break repair protein AddB [Roseibium sp. TrichSKD4]
MQASAPASVYSIPSSVPFLKTLATALVDGTLVPGFRPLDDPLLLPTATLYLPTRRAARLLPEIFQDLFGGKPVLLPVIRPVGDTEEDLQLLSAEADGEALPPSMPVLERHLAMTRLVMAWKGALRREVLNLGLNEPLGVPASAADAAWLAADLLSLMDEIETEEADWSDIAKLVPDDHARYWQITLDFLKIVQEAWPAHLAERGLMDPKARRSALIRKEAERLLTNPPKGPVIVAGVTGSVPATAALLKAVSRLDRSAIVLPGLDLTMDTSSWEALEGPSPKAGTIIKPGGKSMPGLSAHPQYSLKKILSELQVDRSAVSCLGEKPEPALQARERLLSEAMRPAETSDGWMAYLGRVREKERAAALENVSLIAARNEADEALSIAIALREALEVGETAALISPDRFLTRRVASELARWKIQVDDSAGRPLDQTPPAILAILTAKLALYGCDPLDLLALLKHPLCRLGLPAKDNRSAARALERGVLRGPRAAPGTAGLKDAVDAARLEAEKRMAEEGTSRELPRWKKIHEADWTVLSDLVTQLGNALAPLEAIADLTAPMPILDLAEAHARAVAAIAEDETGSPDELYAEEAGDVFAAFMVELLSAKDTGLELKPADWPAVLTALMSGHAVRRRLPGDPRVQILGPLEARLQQFDRVILGSLNEGTWPQKTRNDPWLNRPMKRDLGLEPPERRIGASAHDFCMGFGAKTVILARAARADGAPTVASRWLQRLTTLAGPDITKDMSGRGAVYSDLAEAIDRADGLVTPAPRPNPAPPVAIRPKQLSVTEIERLIRDPYAIFARHVLDLQPVDPIGGEPNAADKGNIIHDALAKFLSDWDGPFNETAVAHLVSIGEKLFAPLDAFPSVRALWWPRFLRIADGFVAFEARRAPKVEHRYLEVGGGVDLKLPSLDFLLKGRADRIDVMENGSIAILDYKTGQVPSLKQVEALLAPQLPLEAAMITRAGFNDIPADRSFSEFLYLQLKGGTDPVIEAPRNPKDCDLKELGEDAFARLETLVVHYSKPETGYLSRARVMKERDIAGPFDHLARVAEWSSAGEDEA